MTSIDQQTTATYPENSPQNGEKWFKTPKKSPKLRKLAPKNRRIEHKTTNNSKPPQESPDHSRRAGARDKTGKNGSKCPLKAQK